MAPEFEAALRDVPGLLGRQLRPADAGTPQLAVDLDREQIAALGLTVDQVESALSSAYGSRQVSQIFAPDDEYQVIMQVAPQYQQDPAALSMLYVQAPGRQAGAALGGRRPRGRASGRSRSTTSASCRRSRSRSTSRPAWRSATPSRGSSSWRARRCRAPCRAASRARRRRSRTRCAASAGCSSLAIFVIYVVLGILYESFIHPLTILSGLPSAGFGALLTLLIFKQDLNIYAFVGVIMLVGLVKKNGIMMIDFAIEARRERGPERGRRDLRGLPGALPADHDDDDGGADGHAADRARLGRRRRGAAAARVWRSSAACSCRRR